MRKTPQFIVHMPILEINLDLGATIRPFAWSSVGSAPNKDKCHVDDIKDPITCTLMYVKGRTSKTIEVAEATVMPSRILDGWPILVDYAMVEVTIIREGCEFEDLDYPNEEEGIEKLVDAKRTFILWPHKDIIVKTHLSSIVLPWSIEVGELLLQTCRCLLNTLIHHRLLPLEALVTQSSTIARGKGRLLPRLKTQSSMTTLSLGCLLILLKTQCFRKTRSLGRLFHLLKTKSSRTSQGKDCLLLLLKTLIRILL
jgi:hypothetical protein